MAAFSTTKRGEIQEWREDLNKDEKNVKKDTVKKVIAAMTVGKDVSALFPDIIKCINTTNLELKKLVYLYIMNYAKSQPDLSILAVNAFVKDSQDPNPLVRALAVRTMSCIRVDKIAEYLAEPLRRALRDEDPYVRKTAAVAVAKFWDMSHQLVEDQGFVDLLKDLISDSNPTVVANAVAALAEMSETASRPLLEYTTPTIMKLLSALNECTEWGQVFILDSVAQFETSISAEAEQICERVAPRLQHANAAVVLSAVKVIIKLLDVITTDDVLRTLLRKLAPPLVTLLSSEPEIQYVALRNIDLVVQKRPGLLSNEVKVFFCKYNDPIYVKLEKLEIMIKLANDRNIEQVLAEFKEYATEVDVEFVRKAVRAIGRCAIKLERAAQKCIDVLLELISTKVNYVVQEAVIVIKDIFRRYPNRYESIIATLCESLEYLDEPEAKASMIWIIGDYAGRIENADELLEVFLETFHDEPAQVQLQLLTATVKLFLTRPNETHALVQRVLTMSTEESDNPDLRDRGYVYWRLLSTDPEAARAVVLADKPVISDDSTNLDPALLQVLCKNIGTLSSVYQKPPELFVPDFKSVQRVRNGAEDEDQDQDIDQSPVVDEASSSSSSSGKAAPSGVMDLLDIGVADMSLKPSSSSASSGAPAAQIDDFFGAAPSSSAAGVASSPAPVVKKNVVLDAARGKGLQISSGFVRLEGQVFHELTFENTTQQPMLGFAIQYNKNTFGLTAAGPLAVPTPLLPLQSANVSLPLAFSPSFINPAVYNRVIQVAIKNNVGVHYLQDFIPLNCLFAEDGRLDKQEFLGLWRSIEDSAESVKVVEASSGLADNAEAFKAKMEATNIFFVAKRTAGADEKLYFAARVTIAGRDAFAVLLEATLTRGSSSIAVATRTAEKPFVPLIEECIAKVLTGQ